MIAKTNTDNSPRKRLKHYRRLKNFSQESLAESSGISIRTIQRIETGESIGSAYTLNKLARALGLEVSELIPEQTTDSLDPSNSKDKLNLLNLSALSVILIPLSNLILPLVILLKNKGNTELHQPGLRIVNFQILWTLSTLVLMIVIPPFLLLSKPFQGSSIPLSIAVYYLCVVVNVYFTLKFSIAINKQEPFLNHLPKIL